MAEVKQNGYGHLADGNAVCGLVKDINTSITFEKFKYHISLIKKDNWYTSSKITDLLNNIIANEPVLIEFDSFTHYALTNYFILNKEDDAELITMLLDFQDLGVEIVHFIRFLIIRRLSADHTCFELFDKKMTYESFNERFISSFIQIRLHNKMDNFRGGRITFKKYNTIGGVPDTLSPLECFYLKDYNLRPKIKLC